MADIDLTDIDFTKLRDKDLHDLMKRPGIGAETQALFGRLQEASWVFLDSSGERYDVYDGHVGDREAMKLGIGLRHHLHDDLIGFVDSFCDDLLASSAVCEQDAVALAGRVVDDVVFGEMFYYIQDLDRLPEPPADKLPLLLTRRRRKRHHAEGVRRFNEWVDDLPHIKRGGKHPPGDPSAA